MDLILALIAGTVTGVLSGYGIGGGTLLMIYLTAIVGMNQISAQGINLVYFLPCSAAAIISHAKNKLIDKEILIPAAIAGVITTPLSAMLATSIDAILLRRLFGGFLLAAGIWELFRKTPDNVE